MTRPLHLALALGMATLLAAAPAGARCLIFCNDIVQPEEAAAVFARDLGRALPAGVAVVRMIDGGFQDRFVQIKLRADAEGTAALLAALKVDTLRPLAPGSRHATITEARWWDINAHADLALYEARLGRFAHAEVAVAPDPADPARRLIYILAFEV
jgi:hypothetical protein